MLHCKTVPDSSRPLRVGALVLVSALLVAACTDSDDVNSSGSKQRTVNTSTPSASSEPGSATTGGQTSNEDLPELEDVTTEAWEPETRTDELAVEIGQEELTPQQAVDAFALLYPDMPGATPSDLPPGPGLDPSYTWMLIRSVRDELAPDQQAAVDTASAGDELGTIDEDGTLSTTDFADKEIPGVGDPPPDTTDGTSSTKPGGFVARPTAGTQTYARYAKLAAQTKRDWLAHRSDMPPYTIKIKLSKQGISGGGMDTGPVAGTPQTCITRVDPGFVSANPSDALIKFFFAHEFFHCIQFQWNPAMDWRVAKWVFDGSADYAALDVYRNAYVPDARGLWQQWFSSPGRPLASRWYDAWPLFETQWEEGTDPFPGIKAMVVGVSSSDPNADLPLAGMDALLFRMKWASRSYRSTKNPADDWQLDWPGPAKGAGPRENGKNNGSRGLGTYDVASKGGYVHPTLLVQMNRDVGYIDVTPSAGPLTTQTAAGVIHVAEGSTARLCFEADGCMCPEGSDNGSQQMAGREMIFSFAAANQPTIAHVEAHKWDKKAEEEKCRKKMPKRGSSNGDPHLVTFDGQPYDMMTLGEFVTARDPAGDFEVQTRNITAAGTGLGTLSSAVAVDTGEQRITFTKSNIESPDDPVVRIDGTPTTETDIVLDGVTVHRDGTDVTMSWPDGSTVELTFMLGWFVTISPSDQRAAVLEGLLGSADGDFVNDLRLPDGTIVDPVYAAVPDSDFSKAWRVDEATSLFDYDSGESVATFSLPYPGDPFTQLLEGALDQCVQALSEQAASYEVNSCTYDVSVTGDDAYVEAYETVVDAREAAEAGDVVVTEQPEAPPAGSVAEPTRTGAAALTLSATLVASYSDRAGDADVVTSLSGSVRAKSGTVMVFRAERCVPGVTLFLNVTQRESDAPGSSFICDPGDLQLALADEDDQAVPGEIYLWLPADGDYDITIDTDGEDPSFVSVDVFVDAEPTIVDGADVIEDGYRTTLHGVGDTVVITSPDTGAAFTATGLDTACATEAYGASPIGTDEVWALAGFCAHADTVSLPGSDVPLVLFSRTDDPVDVALVPQ